MKKEVTNAGLADMIDVMSANMDQRFGIVDQKFFTTDQKFDSIDKKFEGLTQSIKDLAEATSDGFVRVEERIEKLEGEVRSTNQHIDRVMMPLLDSHARRIKDLEVKLA